MKVLLFGLLFAGFFLGFEEMRMLGHMREAYLKTKTGMNAAARQRNLAQRQNVLQFQQTHSFWYSLEQTLQYSGLKRRFPHLTGEWFLAWNLLGGAGLWVIMSVAAGPAAAAAVTALAAAAELGVIRALRRWNRKRTEENLPKLLDFLGNYSVTTGEITGIFDQIGRYMEEPIKEALDACYYEATTTGDSSAALLMMAERVEHPKFKELARNLEVSIRYCADLGSLVNGSRRSLREYLRAAQERRGLMREGMINLALLSGMSAIVLLSIGSLTGINMVTLLTGTWPGRIGLILLAGILVFFLGRMNHLD